MKKQPKPKPRDVALERVYPFIVKHVMKNQKPPTMRQIAGACQLSSTSVASDYVDILVSEGLIEKDPVRARGLRVVGMEYVPEQSAPARLVQVLTKGG